LEQEFWSKHLSQMNNQSEPPSTTFSQMFTVLRKGTDAQNEKEALIMAMAIKSSHEDTHPCLSDRLSAIGYFKADENSNLLQLPALPAPAAETAAQYFFGEKLKAYTDSFNHQWQEQVGPQWRDRHRQLKDFQRRLQTLETKASQQTLTDSEQWERIELKIELEGNDSVVPLLKELLVKNPDHAKLNFVLGCITLAQKDENGIALIERAMQSEAEYTFSGCENIYVFLLKQGRKEEAEKYREKAISHYQKVSGLQNEH